MAENATQNKLFNRNFLLVSLAAFLLSTAFYMLMPIIAKYTIDTFHTSATVAGVVVSAYIISSLLMRPFSGYITDRFPRRGVYILSYAVFVVLVYGYLAAASVALLITLRVLLGGTFSVVTTSGNTLAIDHMPPARRGEGIGYFGAFTVLSMAIGPMVGLYLIENYSYDAVFLAAGTISLLGALAATGTQNLHRPIKEATPLSWDRFFLKCAWMIALAMMTLSFPYGVMMVYMPLYIGETGLELVSANYFLYFAIGVIVARLASGRLLNRGLHTRVLALGIGGVGMGILIFTLWLTPLTFVMSSVVLGLSYGALMPAVQSMIINLAPHSRRGTANSTYLIALDMGSGIGMLSGGAIAQATSFTSLFLYCALMVVACFALLLPFVIKSYPKLLEKYGQNS